MSRYFRTQDEFEKEFVGIVNALSGSRQKWQIWEDLITVAACSISNTVDRTPVHFEKREKNYMDAIERIGDTDLAAKAFSVIVEALDNNPDQDFLGSLYMRMELGSHWHGQFFTPYSLCRLVAEVEMPDPKAEVEKKGWISVCDPAIGGGAMLVATATRLRNKNINYHDHVLFVGQDIDRIAGMMAYIQLSLLGCPGYICIADTLTNPLTGDVLMPGEKEGQDIWYMPFFFKDTWEYRRRFRMMDRLFKDVPGPYKQKAVPIISKERHVVFFNFAGGIYDTGKTEAGSC